LWRILFLRLAEEEVSLWSPGAGPRPSNLVVAKDHVIPAQREGVVMARTRSPLGVENGLVEPNPQSNMKAWQEKMDAETVAIRAETKALRE
jgi:hypothetical protein